MSKTKKAAYAARQKAAADAAALSPLSQDAPMPKRAKKTTTRKQSRGK